jgi:hypothetical protein
MDAVVIDDCGEVWSAASPQLRRRIGSGSDPELAPDAIGRLGFVLVQRERRIVRVALRPDLTRPITLVGLLYALYEFLPDRIVLSRLDRGTVADEIFSDIPEFSVAVEKLVQDLRGDAAGWTPSVLPRSASDLARPRFARFLPMVEQWRARSGLLPEDWLARLRRFGFDRRAVLGRSPAGSEHLVFEYLGPGFTWLDPCWGLTAIGREIRMLPDAAFGAWTAEAYGRVLGTREPSLATVNAAIGTQWGERIRIHFDRLTLPWWSLTGERFVLSLSTLRRRVLVG